MKKDVGLPYAILKKACYMFAGPTGFSYAEMEDFFCDALGESPQDVNLPSSSNKKEMFKNYLSLFPLPEQKRLLLRLCKEELPMRWGQPTKEDCQKLSLLLENFPINNVASEIIQSINSETIKDIWRTALERRNTDPEGAITTARTLLESTCKFILDDGGIIYDDKWDLPKLYRTVAEQMTLAPNQHTEQVFKQILGACQSVVEAVGTIRNRLGDAHGKGRVRAKPSPRHAELAVNLAGAMATFLIATWEARKK